MSRHDDPVTSRMRMPRNTESIRFASPMTAKWMIGRIRQQSFDGLPHSILVIAFESAHDVR